MKLSVCVKGRNMGLWIVLGVDIPIHFDLILMVSDLFPFTTVLFPFTLHFLSHVEPVARAKWPKGTPYFRPF